MQTDRYAFRHSTPSGAAVGYFEAATHAVLAHRPAASALQSTLTVDPSHVGAIALQGFAAMLAGSAQSVPVARAMAAQSVEALRATDGGTACEQTMVEALAQASQGKLSGAAQRLEAHLASSPQTILVAKLAHALRFMSGDTKSMLATTSAILPRLDASAAGYGFVLGCHAFSLEETGSFVEADAAGRAAVALVPHDVWALHAVAHVMEMGGRAHDGIAWLQPTRSAWPSCSIFGGHLAWHLALFHLAAAEAAEALSIFDAHLSSPSECDFRDLANAASLLWRIEQEGMAVGDRWHRIAHLAHARRRDTTYVFGTLHTLLALIGANRIDAARETVAALRRSATADETDQNRVARDIGADLGDVILSLAERRQARISLASLGLKLQKIGGSIAQRDVFLRTLLLMAADAGDEIGTAKLNAQRHGQRQEDRFSSLLDRRARATRMTRTTEPLIATA